MITATAASTGTATLDLKTLTIGGRKVTLTVFRQIREAALIADDGTLNGHPWGVVNYHPDKCGDYLPHWHIVWQRDSEILRSRVYEKATFDWPTSYALADPIFQSPETDQYVTSNVHEWINGRLDEAPLKERTGARGYRSHQTFTEGTLTVRGDASTAAASAAARHHDVLNPPTYDSYGYRPDPERLAAEFNQARDRLAEEIAGWESTREQIITAYQTTVASEQKRRQRHRDLRAQLAAELPQLFIAL
ncbi:hypothetical protein [Streptosporangium sp. NPDC051022]|uniref:hypothetical protein n=1 Tax=Streptosporangium sp. NPDC051022 TaxID=3155752 RepID=UPI0034217E49